jgi:sortase A
MRTFFKLLSWVLLLGGIYIAYQGGSDFYESFQAQREQARLWGDPSVQTMHSLTHPGKREVSMRGRLAAPKGSSIAKLSIPRLDTVLYVVEGTDNNDLKRGPGHVEGTVMPGSDGNCVIAGHRDTHFRVLKSVEKGDEIVVQSREGTYRYQVSGVSVIAPENTDCLRPTSKAVLNLVTCFPFEYVGSAPRRFVVHANLMPSSRS